MTPLRKRLALRLHRKGKRERCKTTNTCAYAQPVTPTGSEASAHQAANSHGRNGGSESLAGAKAFLNTPDAIESRTVLKQVLMDEYHAGRIDADTVADNFERYELRDL